MPYFRLRLKINEEMVQRLRTMPDRARSLMRVKLQTILKSELQADIDSLFEQGPEPVDSPFHFQTPPSRRKYFAIVTESPSLSDGRHWIRVGTTEEGFAVEVSDQFSIGLVTARNIQPTSRFLFGPPFPVEGHRLTGWPEFAQLVHQLLQEKMVMRVGDLWRDSLREAL